MADTMATDNNGGKNEEVKSLNHKMKPQNESTFLQSDRDMTIR